MMDEVTYYATVDENGVLCVDQYGEAEKGAQSTPEGRDKAQDSAARNAKQYPHMIYFTVPVGGIDA